LGLQLLHHFSEIFCFLLANLVISQILLFLDLKDSITLCFATCIFIALSRVDLDMDPAQLPSFWPLISASTGANLMAEEAVTSATPATALAIIYPALSDQIPSGVVAVPLNEQDPQKMYSRWNGQAVEVMPQILFSYIRKDISC